MTNISNISPKDAKALLDSGDAVLIDVREPAEYRAENIKKAHNIPLSKITADDVQPYTKDNKIILVHCKSGRRSADACKKLSLDMNADLRNVEGGIEAWRQAGFKTRTSDSAMLPLDRQVQLVISMMIIIGLAIYYFASPIGLILPLIAGLGLLNAALTGWCGMARFLAIMPWNQ